MPTSYETAVESLYRAPLAEFVAERKRLAAQLKEAGHKPEAARLTKLGRPSIAAWAVNQLWWHERLIFEELFATARRLRRDRDAIGAHREIANQLRSRAEKLLSAGGHAASETTLRRVTMTLSALAAHGSFDPDPPGALPADRDPPGFEAVGIGSAEPDEKPTPNAERPKRDDAPQPDKPSRRATVESDSARRREREEALATRQRESAERERLAERERVERESRAERERRAELERAKAEQRRLAEQRTRLQKGLDAARRELTERAKAAAILTEQLEAAENLRQRADARVQELQAELDALD